MDDDFGVGGNVAELKPRGIARYFDALFLAAWLIGWLLGELVALFAVFSILGAAFFPQLLPSWQTPRGMELGAGSLTVLLFLFFWLALWTLGGLAALDHLLRSVGGVDRISVEGGDLHVRSGFGPFHKERVLRRDSLRRVYTSRGQYWLAAATDRGEVTLTRFGTRDERALLADRLRAQLGIPRGEAAVESDQRDTPTGWAVSSEASGATALDRDPRARAIAGRVCAGLALGASGLVIAWIVRAGSSVLAPASLVGIVPMALFAMLMACGWLWFARGVDRMIVGHGSLTIERRFAGREWRWEYAPPVLTLEQSVDSDGDEHFRLFVLGPERRRRRIATAIGHARDPLHLGRWLAFRAGAGLHVPPGLGDA